MEFTHYRELLLVFAFLIIMIGIEIVIILLQRARSSRRIANTTRQIFRSFAFLMIGYTIANISITFQRFLTFIPIPSWVHQYFHYQTWFFIGLGGLVAYFLLENLYQDVFKTKYIFSIGAGIIVIINFLSWQQPFFEASVLLLFTFFNVFLFFFLQFLYHRSSASIRKYVRLFIISFSFFLCNFLFALDITLSLIVFPEVFIFLYFLQLVGSYGLFYAFLRIPTLYDADWRDSIEEIYVISKVTNETVFYYNFMGPTQKYTNNNAGSLAGIDVILAMLSTDYSKTTESGFNIIEQPRNVILMTQEKDYLGVLTVRSLFSIHKSLLTQLLHDFIVQYDFLLSSCHYNCDFPEIFTGFSERLQTQIFSKPLRIGRGEN